MTKPLSGIIPALSTPFDDRGALAVDRIRENIGRYNRVDLSGYLANGSTGESIMLDPFVPVPVLAYPAYGGAWDGRRISYAFAVSGTPVDLTVIQIGSGGGLVNWLVAAPGGTREITLPDLRTAFPDGAPVPGSVSVSIFGGRIAGFDYGQLRYRQLGPQGFDAYSLDTFPARYP